MRCEKLRKLIAFSIIILILAGCSNDIENVKIKSTIEIQFEFHTTNLEDSYDAPLTEVYLHIKDEGESKKTKVGEYIGYFDKTTPDDSGWELPENSEASYIGWYGGQGDILGIELEKNKIIKIMHKSIEESGGDVDLREEIKNTKYEVIAEFHVDENSELVVEEAIHIKD